jgi:hypothetical protein
LKFDIGPGLAKFWTKDIAKKRWIALFKAFKDARKLGSKGNSTAGATAQQIASNTTSLLVMQHKKCPSFEAMQKLFGESPSCKPVRPQEIGGMSDGDCDSVEDEGDDGQEFPAAAVVGDTAPNAAPPPATGKALSAAAAPLAATTGKAAAVAAVFHLAPSKNKVRNHCHRRVYVTVTQEKKMDLGEAYMKAQQLKIESAAATANTKTRTDLVIAMMVAKKTPEEIAAILKLAGF